jgi:hypothetical protein
MIRRFITMKWPIRIQGHVWITCSCLKKCKQITAPLPPNDLHFPPDDLQQPSVTYMWKKQPIRIKGCGRVKSVISVLCALFEDTPRNVNKSPHPTSKWPTFSFKWPWTAFSDLHWEETANQSEGVWPGEISHFSTLCSFWSYTKKCKQITPSHLKMTYFCLQITLNDLQKPQFRGYGRGFDSMVADETFSPRNEQK